MMESNYEYRPEDRAKTLTKGYRGSIIDHPAKWDAIEADIVDAIKAAVVAELERCAKILDDANEKCFEQHACCHLEELAAKIRARK